MRVQLSESSSWMAASNCCHCRYSEHSVKALRRQLDGQQPVETRRQTSGPRSKQTSRYSHGDRIPLKGSDEPAACPLLLRRLRSDFLRDGDCDRDGTAAPRTSNDAHLRLANDGCCRRYCCRCRAADPSCWTVLDARRRNCTTLSARSRQCSWPRSLLKTSKQLLLCQLTWNGIWR